MNEKFFSHKIRNIAIIGGGIYGCQIALELSKNPELHITIYEKNNDILMGATRNNLWRIHRGYHYPRCEKTAKNSMKSYNDFCQEYEEAVFKYNHLYGIAKKGSKTSAEPYLKFMDNLSLKYQILDTNENWFGKYDGGSYKLKKRNSIMERNEKIFNHDQLDLLVKVEESLYDIDILSQLIRNKIEQSSNITLKLNASVFWSLPEKNDNHIPYDSYILATYYSNSMFAPPISKNINYEFQLCEVIYGELPDKYRGKSLIVLDGEFTSINPVPNSNEFGIYHVKHTKHISFIDTRININKINEKYIPLINGGRKFVPEISKFREVMRDSSVFFQGLEKFVYKGSTFTWRIKRVGVEDKDSRYYNISEVKKNVWSIFSGKVDESIIVGKEMAKLIQEKNSYNLLEAYNDSKKLSKSSLLSSSKTLAENSTEIKKDDYVTIDNYVPTNIIEIGIVGAGYWGTKYIEKITESLDMKINVIVVNTLSSLQKTKQKYPRCFVTNDINDLLRMSNIRGVIVATPDQTHFEISKDCLSAGKHILVEKPFVLYESHVKELFNLAENYKNQEQLVIDTGYIYLNNPYVEKIKKMIVDDEMGEIKCINMQRTCEGPRYKNTNVLWNLLTHDISILLYWFGDFEKNKTNQSDLLKYDKLKVNFRKNDKHVIETCQVMFQLECGENRKQKIMVSVMVSWELLGKTRKFEIYGKEKSIVYDETNGMERDIDKMNVYYTNEKINTFDEFFSADSLDNQIQKWKENMKKPKHVLKGIQERREQFEIWICAFINEVQRLCWKR